VLDNKKIASENKSNIGNIIDNIKNEKKLSAEQT